MCQNARWTQSLTLHYKCFNVGSGEDKKRDYYNLTASELEKKIKTATEQWALRPVFYLK